MNNSEIKQWAKEKIKGNIWTLIVPIVIVSILTSLTIGGGYTHTEDGGYSYNAGVSIGIFFYFVQVGLAYFMVKFINDQPHELKDIFAYTKDYLRIFITGILKGIFTALFTLLFIIPGIIKGLGYALVELILADEKYKDLDHMAVLRKSEELMNGHKMDYFLLGLSFIGWHILAIFTLGILELWITPYYTTAKFKFLDNIMKAAN